MLTRERLPFICAGQFPASAVPCGHSEHRHPHKGRSPSPLPHAVPADRPVPALPAQGRCAPCHLRGPASVTGPRDSEVHLWGGCTLSLFIAKYFDHVWLLLCLRDPLAWSLAGPWTRHRNCACHSFLRNSCGQWLTCDCHRKVSALSCLTCRGQINRVKTAPTKTPGAGVCSEKQRTGDVLDTTSGAVCFWKDGGGPVDAWDSGCDECEGGSGRWEEGQGHGEAGRL